MILADTSSLVIRAVSASAMDILGFQPEALIGGVVTDLFKVENTISFRAAAAARRATPGEHEVITLHSSNNSFYAWIYCSGDITIIDLEPYSDESSSALQSLCKAMDRVGYWVGSEDIERILRETTQIIQEVTGFDRVMVYQFDNDWSGKITAETCKPQVESFLDIHYPATDIPEQARRLYSEVLVRQVVDVDYTPSPLVGDPSLATLDIRHSCLRSSSPLHLQYMRNMGVTASLVGSIIVNEKLWGLLTCHQTSSKKYQSGLAREIFRRVCAAISANISTCNGAKARRRMLEREYLRAAIMTHLESEDLAVGGDPNVLLQALDADGFALLAERRWQSIGITPSEQEMRAFTAKLESTERIIATDSAHQQLGLSFDRDPSRCAGMLMADLADRENTRLFWFRRGQPRVIIWGGNPDKSMTLHEGSPQPRKSFARYQQDIGVRSRAWSAEEIDFADSLRASIKLGQRRLMREIKALQQLMVEVNAAVIITEAESINLPAPRIIMVTQAVERITGYGAEELMGRTPRMFQGQGTDLIVLDKIHDHMLRGKPIGVELIIYRKDGSPVWLELQIVPYAYEKGRVSHWMALQIEVSQLRVAQLESVKKNAFLDAYPASAQSQSNAVRHISSLSRTQPELTQRPAPGGIAEVVALREQFHGNIGHWDMLQERGEHERQNKARFFASASHDLLQPLNAARIYASVLNQQSGMSESTRDIAGRIDVALIAAEEIIDALIEVAKLDSGAIKAEFEEFSLHDLLSSLIMQMSAIASVHGLELRLRPCPFIIRSDPKLLRRVLQNLISNALRYTLKGGVLISARKRGAQLVIEVWDTGIGINEEFAESIFNEFSKVNQTAPRGEKSLGLGLAICDRVCRLLDHDLSMRSKLGVGSCFRVTVAVVNAKAASASLAPARQGSVLQHIVELSEHFTVLCVDDERENLRSISLLLQSWGAQVYTAQSFEEAMDTLSAQQVDVLLTDQSLGGAYDGIALISAALALQNTTLIGSVLITADRSDLIKKRCQEKGILLLGKPLKAVSLRALMTHFAEKKSAPNSA